MDYRQQLLNLIDALPHPEPVKVHMRRKLPDQVDKALFDDSCKHLYRYANIQYSLLLTAGAPSLSFLIDRVATIITIAQYGHSSGKL